MRDDELLFRIALTFIPELGPICTRSLIEHFGEASAVFRARKREISAVPGMGEARAKCLKQWTAFNEAEREMIFLGKNRITPLFITDAAYPKRLLHCYDPPVMLYYRGTADLNAGKTVSVVGTRHNTEYGKQVAIQVVEGLQSQQALIISGLAFGIDAVAHRCAIDQGLATVGVLAHGLDTIYPMPHRSLAKEMIAKGGLLTEFRKNTKPDKHNFPKRNRIVAGISDLTIVIETAVKGGSMITAELAHSYNRDVFAVPGKLTDHRSTGCLQLIQQNKAAVFTSVDELLNVMGWNEAPAKEKKQQRALFVELDADEQVIVALLQQKESLNIDELYAQSKLSSSRVAAALLGLELKNMVGALPGKTYRLL